MRVLRDDQQLRSLDSARLLKAATTAFFVALRVAFGFAWLMAGLTKELEKHWFSEPGVFLTHYLTNARDNPEVNTLYRRFIDAFVLENVALFNYGIPVAQVIVGMLVVFGLFTLPMLLACLFMHVNFILSGNMNVTSLVLYTSLFILLFGHRRALPFSLDGLLGTRPTKNLPGRAARE